MFGFVFVTIGFKGFFFSVINFLKAFKNCTDFFMVIYTFVDMKPSFFIHFSHGKSNLRNLIDFINDVKIDWLFRLFPLNDKLEKLFSGQCLMRIDLVKDCFTFIINNLFLFVQDQVLHFITQKHLLTSFKSFFACLPANHLQFTLAA